jgi:hypothetical protein
VKESKMVRSIVGSGSRSKSSDFVATGKRFPLITVSYINAASRRTPVSCH